ncbi:PhzF family phenazine biosynthesis protein [Pseudomonas sp. CCI3.2]|uniref:PhzF family phenazine biosynthesis protein n=1 Tax=unclassified Pseudomonas TaxID=196821 RepID=UPI002AC96BC1|nr:MULTISPECIES: PhzF family phenazine biosynthesis protein [unclassified Pseudomonas]MEB0077193.1 PhzF family phenazine biosynthesis protein [Pseudomonas sp. MH10out]MEB0091476.1 PhzF family phenazine biosynthesis protein [Pseudomonas sp. CCI4.2]MEB0101540.1 PhzF family phenazine biosynthesis protein [Pseudomonas sp. CCI3.2]MEB0129344.1 PhzF family phenazine biosynthesis protein [Pseudomonas sp. CCI2.4]MEB0157405.1 PhzF family phenazine biosynthesis protein [Pseudomonas sp. AH2 (2023)]
MNRRYVTADVFTDTRFHGNPLAVVLDAEGLSTRQMQTVAAEFNYAETTFVLPPTAAKNTARIRIFTPVREMPFAGHPNIGTAYVLAHQAEKEGRSLPDSITLEQIAGEVPLRFLRQGNNVVGAELVTPTPFISLSTVSAQNAALCLSLSVNDVLTHIHTPQIASVGMPFLIMELMSRNALRACVPNLSAFKSLFPLDGATAVYAYTRAVQDSASACEIEARMFTIRMTEDPATGGAAAALAALLSKVQGVDDLELMIAQGTDIGRPSLLRTAVQTTAKGAFVRLGGECVRMMEGVFFLEGE